MVLGFADVGDGTWWGESLCNKVVIGAKDFGAGK